MNKLILNRIYYFLAIIFCFVFLSFSMTVKGQLSSVSSTKTEAQQISKLIEKLNDTPDNLKGNVRKEIVIKLKEINNSHLNKSISKFRTISSKIGQISVISDAEKNTAIDDIEKEIQFLNAKMVEVQDVSDLNEIVAVTESSREQIKKSYNTVQIICGRIRAEHLMSVYRRFVALGENIGERLDYFQAIGVDTKKQENIMLEANNFIKSGKNSINAKSYNNAINNFISASKQISSVVDQVDSMTKNQKTNKVEE